MVRFLVQWDFQKARPPWVGDLPRKFGKQNEGITIDADDLDDAKRIMGGIPHRLNPFYLMFHPIKPKE